MLWERKWNEEKEKKISIESERYCVRRSEWERKTRKTTFYVAQMANTENRRYVACRNGVKECIVPH